MNERSTRHGGKCPLMLATEQGHEEIVEIVRVYVTSEQQVTNI